MEHLTHNKPKALVPIDNLPMIFHLFRKYPDKLFHIIGDYKYDVLDRYLKAFADVSYEIIDARGKRGTCAGIGDAMSVIPEGEPFMITWCDLILPGEYEIPDLEGNYIGISKDFNNYELVHAIAVKDFRKCELIRRYFVQNPKNNPWVITLSVLFDFFTNLMLSHYASDKSVNGLMREVGMNYGAAKDMVAALKNYSAWKAMENIALIRECDARQKGARGAAVPEDEVLLDLLYRLMH